MLVHDPTQLFLCLLPVLESAVETDASSVKLLIPE
jgi:hypothetical protein